jgi:hypothetical protein
VLGAYDGEGGVVLLEPERPWPRARGSADRIGIPGRGHVD